MTRLLQASLLAFTLFACGACSDMIQSLQAENDAIDSDSNRDQTALKDDSADRDAGARSRSHVLLGPTANNTDRLEPPVRREYSRGLASAPEREEKGLLDHRARDDDFRDKATEENSLWDSQGQSNYLFSNNRHRETGDLVVVDVEKELRREIQYKLWQTLPPEDRYPRRPASASADGSGSLADPSKKPQGSAKSVLEKNKDTAEEAAKTNITSNGKDDDVLPMEVVENLGNGLVRMTGQKRVVYRGVAHMMQVTALVHTKDIDDQNHIKSSSFVDMQTQVIQ